MSETDVRFLRSQTERLVVQSKSKMKSNAALGPANRRSVRSARSGLSFAHPSLTCFDPEQPMDRLKSCRYRRSSAEGQKHRLRPIRCSVVLELIPTPLRYFGYPLEL